MRRQNPLTLNEAISIKELVAPEQRPFLHTSWVGVCQEILEALEGSEDHDVVRVHGRRVIYRNGYVYPYFIEVGGSSFVCPAWG